MVLNARDAKSPCRRSFPPNKSRVSSSAECVGGPNDPCDFAAAISGALSGHHPSPPPPLSPPRCSTPNHLTTQTEDLWIWQWQCAAEAPFLCRKEGRTKDRGSRPLFNPLERTNAANERKNGLPPNALVPEAWPPSALLIVSSHI